MIGLALGLAVWLSTLLLASFTFAQILLAVSPSWERNPELVVLGSAVAGPPVLTVILAACLMVAPGFSPEYYVAAVLTIQAALLYSLRRHRAALAGAVLALVWRFVGDLWRPRLTTGLKWVVLVYVGALALIGVAHPLTANDPLEYAQVARLIFENASLANYPVLDPSLANGNYAPWSHPPVNVLLIAWCFMLEGEASGIGIAKLTALYFVATTTLLLAHLLGRWHRVSGWVAALVYLSTPLVVAGAMDNAIDPLRIGVFFLFFAMYRFASETLDVRSSVALGLLMGIAMLTHSINILIVPIAVVMVAACNRDQIGVRAKHAMVLLGAGLAVASVSYISNLINFGALVTDEPPVWQLAQLERDHYIEVVREISGIGAKVVFGLLMGITDYGSFGISYFLVLAAAVLLLSRHVGAYVRTLRADPGRVLWHRPTLLNISWIVVALFYGGVGLTVLLDMSVLIKNARYVLTVQPFIALIVGYCLQAAFLDRRRVA